MALRSFIAPLAVVAIVALGGLFVRVSLVEAQSDANIVSTKVNTKSIKHVDDTLDDIEDNQKLMIYRLCLLIHDGAMVNCGDGREP